MSHEWATHSLATNESQMRHPLHSYHVRLGGSFVTHSHRLHIYVIRLIPYAHDMLVSLPETYAKRIPHARDMTHLTHKLSLRETCFVLVNRRTDDCRQAYGLSSVKWVNLTLHRAYRLGVSDSLCASNTPYIRIPLHLQLHYRPTPWKFQVDKAYRLLSVRCVSARRWCLSNRSLALEYRACIQHTIIRHMDDWVC